MVDSTAAKQKLMASIHRLKDENFEQRTETFVWFDPQDGVVYLGSYCNSALIERRRNIDVVVTIVRSNIDVNSLISELESKMVPLLLELMPEYQGYCEVAGGYVFGQWSKRGEELKMLIYLTDLDLTYASPKPDPITERLAAIEERLEVIEAKLSGATASIESLASSNSEMIEVLTSAFNTFYTFSQVQEKIAMQLGAVRSTSSVQKTKPGKIQSWLTRQ